VCNLVVEITNYIS